MANWTMQSIARNGDTRKSRYSANVADVTGAITVPAAATANYDAILIVREGAGQVDPIEIGGKAGEAMQTNAGTKPFFNKPIT